MVETFWTPPLILKGLPAAELPNCERQVKPGTAIFLSEAVHPGPQFRLVYELNAAVMSGKFQMKMPGQPDWKTYLEWSGGKK